MQEKWRPSRSISPENLKTVPTGSTGGKLKKTGVGNVPILPLHSASLEEKLNEITNRLVDYGR